MYGPRRLLVAGRALLSVGVAPVAFATTYPTMLAGMVVLVALFAVVGAEVRAVQSFTNVFAPQAVGGEAGFGNRMLSPTMVAAGVASTVAGYVVDRPFAGGCFAPTAVTVGGVVALPLGRAGLALAFVVLGVVMYSVYPATDAPSASLATEDSSGSVFAVAQTAAALDGATGPFLVGAAADTTTLSAGFLPTAGVAAVGVAVVLAAAALEA